MNMKISPGYIEDGRIRISPFLVAGIGTALLIFTLFYAGSGKKASTGPVKTEVIHTDTDEPYYRGAAFLFWTFSRLWFGNIGEWSELLLNSKDSVLSQKKSFVIRIDNDTYKALEKWAADEFRSVNGQIEWILSQKLKETGREKNSESKTTKTNNKNNWKSGRVKFLYINYSLLIIIWVCQSVQ